VQENRIIRKELKSKSDTLNMLIEYAKEIK